MSWAVTGPMPSIVSSSATVAVPRLIGPSSLAAPAARFRRPRACRAPAGDPFRDHHLLAVGQTRRQVYRFELRLPAGAARPLDRVVDPAPRRHPVDAGIRDRAGDVDDQIAPFPADREFARFATFGAGFAFFAP